ncbi:MAG: hypothetical protein ACI4WM_02045 [Erysipelotrichaceae bacterium]
MTDLNEKVNVTEEEAKASEENNELNEGSLDQVAGGAGFNRNPSRVVTVKTN